MKENKREKEIEREREREMVNNGGNLSMQPPKNQYLKTTTTETTILHRDLKSLGTKYNIIVRL